MKDNQKLIIGIVLVALFIFYIGPQLGLFSINLVSTPEILSDFIGKAGLSSSINQTDYWSSGNFVQWANEVIDKYYAFGIFDGPVKISAESKQRIAEQMLSLNGNIRNMLQGYGLSTGEDIFSQTLITTIQKESYTETDFDNIINELGKVPKRYCNAIILEAQSQEFSSEYNQVQAYCNSLPANIFTKSGSKWVLVTLPDFTMDLTHICNIAEADNIADCQAPTLTLKLSHLKAEMFLNNNDIFIGVGNKGVADINTISPKYEFAQYAYQIDQESCGEDINVDSASCVAISNSADVISASEGIIKESNQFSDLWYGLTKKGQGFTDPIFLIAGGIVVVVILFLLLKK